MNIEIYDINGNLLTEEPDLSLGYLTDSTRTEHHDAIQQVVEQGHWDIIAEYPNGGKDVEWIIDVPGVQAKEAWDEEIPIQIYTLYTEEELEEIHERENQPDAFTLLQQKVATLEAHNEFLENCVLEMSEIIYA